MSLVFIRSRQGAILPLLLSLSLFLSLCPSLFASIAIATANVDDFSFTTQSQPSASASALASSRHFSLHGRTRKKTSSYPYVYTNRSALSIPVLNKHKRVLLSVQRGGASTKPFRFRSRSSLDNVGSIDEKPSNKTKIVKTTLFSALVVYFLYIQRHTWMPFFNKEKIQQATLDVLSRLKSSDDESGSNAIKPMLFYAAGMCLWELLGLSTIPVETAAGMVFGWRASVFSFFGKLTGAFAAFCLGRYLLASQVAGRLGANEIFQLINANPDDNVGTEQHMHHPLLTSFLMKFSMFPELLKNFGSSLLPVVKPWMFILATTVHGGMFTLLWTWVGVDTAYNVQTSPTSNVVEVSTHGGVSGLQIALIAAAIVGFVLTPLAMAWWVRDLKRLASERTGSKYGP